MNYKLYTLLFMLFLTISPALQAMKRVLVPIARSMRRTAAYQAGWQTIARGQFANNNEGDERRYYKTNDAYNAIYPSTTAITAGALALEDQADDNLDMNKVWVVIDALKKCPKKQQEKIATAIAQNIDKYDLWDLGKILEATPEQYQKSITTAIVQNFDKFKKHWALPILLKAINQENQEPIIIAIAQNIDKYDLYDLGEMLKVTHEQNQKAITTAIAQNIDKYYLYDLVDIVKVTHEQNQKPIITAIEQTYSEKEIQSFQHRLHFQNESGIFSGSRLLAAVSIAACLIYFTFDAGD